MISRVASVNMDIWLLGNVANIVGRTGRGLLHVIDWNLVWSMLFNENRVVVLIFLKCQLYTLIGVLKRPKAMFSHCYQESKFMSLVKTSRGRGKCDLTEN